MQILTDFPERIVRGAVFFLGPEHRAVVIRSVKLGGKKNTLGLEGVHTRDQAEALRGQVLFVRAADLPPLPEGDYYHHQILGLTVITEEGKVLGEVAEILTTGATDVYLIRSATGEVLIPASDEVIRKVDLHKGELFIHLLPGLLPE